jgi:hypothetical protein
MSEEERVSAAEDLLLNWLRQAGRPVTAEELDHLRRGAPAPISPLDVQGASWNLVNSGKAKFTPDRRLLAVDAA